MEKLSGFASYTFKEISHISKYDTFRYLTALATLQKVFINYHDLTLENKADESMIKRNDPDFNKFFRL